MGANTEFRAWADGKMHYLDWKRTDWWSINLRNRLYRKGAHLLMKYLSVKDMDLGKIYDGDLLNVFFTSGDGKNTHDYIYRATTGKLGDVQFEFVNLLWGNHGHNQYPVSTKLCIRYDSLSMHHKEGISVLCVPDSYHVDSLSGRRWKDNDRSFYFKKIGNIHEGPDLLEKRETVYDFFDWAGRCKDEKPKAVACCDSPGKDKCEQCQEIGSANPNNH